MRPLCFFLFWDLSAISRHFIHSFYSVSADCFVCLWYDQWHKTMARRGKSSDEEVSFRDVMSANRYRKARNVFLTQVDTLIWEDTTVSYERILWSIDGRCYLLCVRWQVRGVGDSVRAVKPIDKTVAQHFPGDFIVNWLFFSVVIDMNTSLLHDLCDTLYRWAKTIPKRYFLITFSFCKGLVKMSLHQGISFRKEEKGAYAHIV